MTLRQRSDVTATGGQAVDLATHDLAEGDTPLAHEQLHGGVSPADPGRSSDEMLHAFPGPLGEEVGELVSRLGTSGAAILPVLEAVQRARGSISDTAFRIAARALGVRPVDLKELAVVSGRFTVERRPAHVVVVCVHKHCRARGAPALLDAIRETTGLAPGGTSAGGDLSLETALCVGECKVGPNVLVDGAWYPGVDVDGMRSILEVIAGPRPSS
jgi:NADH:ubiquinone oxidoreductase subunit E